MLVYPHLYKDGQGTQQSVIVSEISLLQEDANTSNNLLERIWPLGLMSVEIRLYLAKTYLEIIWLY